MKANQAKRVLGITFDTRTESGRLKALEAGKRQIVAARKAGDDARASELSEAREIFKKRRQNRCAVCGVTINAKATHCTQHQRKKAPQALPLPPDFELAQQRRKTRRKAGMAKGGDLAELGFYAAPVQKVARKWKKAKARQEWIEQTFRDVAFAVLFRQDKAQIEVAFHGLWLMAFELGEAICAVMTDESKPEAWLLRSGLFLQTNGQLKSTEAIADELRRESGKPFTHSAVRGAISRLKLASDNSA